MSPVGGAGLADENRCDDTVRRRVQRAIPPIYNCIRRECSTEYLWIVEDDVIPPLDLCERLLRSFDFDTASVAAPYWSRFHPGYVVRDTASLTVDQPGDGVERVGFNGFGCTILRRSVLERVEFREDADCDVEFYRRLPGGLAAKVDWSHEAAHLASRSG